MIRLLLDQGLPLRAAADLREQGHDVVHVRERGLERARDSELLDYAATEDRVLVTLDSDFSRLLAASGAKRPSVIHIRLHRVPRKRAVTLPRKLVGVLEDRLEVGCIASVTASGVRVRRLPVEAES